MRARRRLAFVAVLGDVGLDAFQLVDEVRVRCRRSDAPERKRESLARYSIATWVTKRFLIKPSGQASRG